jgi:hypothetical protein
MLLDLAGETYHSLEALPYRVKHIDYYVLQKALPIQHTLSSHV